MSLTLNIATALDPASICLSENGVSIGFARNENPHNHGGWPHEAIAGLMKEAQLEMTALDAIAVTIGPGSYTGLRVGLATAKGLCFALKIPLIAVNTLEVIAHSVFPGEENLICPMIDARRQEVFTAVYNNVMEEKMPACAMVLTSSSFENELKNGPVLFCGEGAKKWQEMNTNSNAQFDFKKLDAKQLAHLAYKYFQKQAFADLAYTEPLYLKEFYTGQKTG